MTDAVIFGVGLLVSAICTAALILLLRAAVEDSKPPS